MAHVRFGTLAVIACSSIVITACGGGGGGNSGSTTTTPAASIENFYPENYKLSESGGGTTLTGEFHNGTGSIDNGVGAVSSGAPNAVDPATTTTYTLDVNGGGVKRARSLTLTRLKSTESVAAANSLVAARQDHTATLLANGQILVTGGHGRHRQQHAEQCRTL